MTALLTKAVAMIAAGFGLYRILEDLTGGWLWLALTAASIAFVGGILLVIGVVIPSTRQ